MMIKYKKAKMVVILIIVLSFNQLYAQSDVAIFLRGNISDAQKFAKAYTEPFGNMLGNSLNGGWYTSAKPHGLFGFDITFSATLAIAPSSDKTFDITKLGLSNNFQLVTGQPTKSPTVVGSKSAGPLMNYSQTINGVGTFNTQFNLPQGAGVTMTPMPMVQVGLGLPFHTELMGRYLPTIDVPKVGKFGMWGFGIKNEFKEFIPGLKALPINLSVLFGYTNLSSEFDVSYKPQIYPSGSSSSSYNGQKLELNAKGYTARLLVGKSIPILTVYAGVGYSKSETNFDLKGKYPFGLANDGGVIKVADNNDLMNPISLVFDDSGISFNAGLRLKFGVLALHFDYTLGKYALYNAGVGINFR